MRKLLLAAALLAFLAPAAEARSMKAGKFVENAAMSDMFEIESSRVALDKAERDDVKRFAQHMVDDHTKMSSEMKTLVQRLNLPDVKVPGSLDRKHAKQIEKLKSASGAKFDSAYIDAQVKGHNDAVKLFKSYAQSGDNPELKAAAEKNLPMIQSHLDEAKSLKAAKGNKPARTSSR